MCLISGVILRSIKNISEPDDSFQIVRKSLGYIYLLKTSSLFEMRLSSQLAGHRLGWWDASTAASSTLQLPIIETAACGREMLLKGVTLYPCQSKYLMLRTRKTGVGGDRAESYLACPLVCWYWSRVRTSTPPANAHHCGRYRGRGHSPTLIRHSVSSFPALIGPLILWARLSLLLQSFLPSLGWHHIADVKDV